MLEICTLHGTFYAYDEKAENSPFSIREREKGEKEEINNPLQRILHQFRTEDLNFSSVYKVQLITFIEEIYAAQFLVSMVVFGVVHSMSFKIYRVATAIFPSKGNERIFRKVLIFTNIYWKSMERSIYEAFQIADQDFSKGVEVLPRRSGGFDPLAGGLKKRFYIFIYHTYVQFK